MLGMQMGCNFCDPGTVQGENTRTWRHQLWSPGGKWIMYLVPSKNCVYPILYNMQQYKNRVFDAPQLPGSNIHQI